MESIVGEMPSLPELAGIESDVGNKIGGNAKWSETRSAGMQSDVVAEMCGDVLEDCSLICVMWDCLRWDCGWLGARCAYGSSQKSYGFTRCEPDNNYYTTCLPWRFPSSFSFSGLTNVVSSQSRFHCLCCDSGLLATLFWVCWFLFVSFFLLFSMFANSHHSFSLAGCCVSCLSMCKKMVDMLKLLVDRDLMPMLPMISANWKNFRNHVLSGKLDAFSIVFNISLSFPLLVRSLSFLPSFSSMLCVTMKSFHLSCPCWSSLFSRLCWLWCWPVSLLCAHPFASRTYDWPASTFLSPIMNIFVLLSLFRWFYFLHGSVWAFRPLSLLFEFFYFYLFLSWFLLSFFLFLLVLFFLLFSSFIMSLSRASSIPQLTMLILQFPIQRGRWSSPLYILSSSFLSLFFFSPSLFASQCPYYDSQFLVH